MKSNKNFLARFRGWIQAAATLLTNIHIPNLFKGKIYQGNVKTMCVPGLNCYSCPAATGACPIGAFQAVVGSSKFKFTYYITGFFILLGVLLGRFICGFLCPFGWFQDLLHKIPGKKLSTAKLKPLRYLKYVILVVFVILLPAFVTNSLGMGDPFFCKYICPQGVLEGAIPLSLANSGIRAALGHLFTFKFTVLALFIILSILFYRPYSYAPTDTNAHLYDGHFAGKIPLPSVKYISPHMFLSSPLSRRSLTYENAGLKSVPPPPTSVNLFKSGLICFSSVISSSVFTLSSHCMMRILFLTKKLSDSVRIVKVSCKKCSTSSPLTE